MAKKEAKQKLKRGIKKIYSEHKEKVLDLLNDVLQDQLKNLVTWLKDMTRIKKMMRKCFISVIVGIAAVALGLTGLANILADYFTDLSLGIWQIIVAAVTIIIISIYMKK